MPNPTGTINADEDHSGKTITNVPDPSAAQDVATKAYADSISAGGVNAFGTIVVAGQSNVVADAAPDTLTLAAGSNVTLTTNASTDTVTIAASGGGGGTWGSITGTLSAQTDLQTALNAKVDENAGITGATKTKVTYDAKGLVTAGADATTADIADSTNKRYVTDAQLTVIGNTSGTNTGNQTITLTGDVTGTGTGSFAATVANDAVTYAKMQNVSAASKLLGRGDSGSGDVEQITLGGNLTMTGTTLDTTAGSAGVSDAAYDSSWNGVTGTAPSKNAVYDALQTIGSGGATTVKVAGSNFTNTSTSLVNITGLTFAATANKLYEVECTLKMRSSQSGGTGFAVVYSAAGATGHSMSAAGTTVSSAALDCAALGTAIDTFSGATVDTDMIVKIWAVVTIGANTGNITIQTKQASGGTGTIYIGSRMTVTELA